MSYFVPTRFLWRFGGKQVHLCGSFTRWVETIPMIPVEGSPGVFAVVVHLTPGYHQYKFIIDGKWRHDETAPFMPDPLGNVNNWLFVRKLDSAPTPPQLQFAAQSPLPFDPAHLPNVTLPQLAPYLQPSLFPQVAPMQQDLTSVNKSYPQLNLHSQIPQNSQPQHTQVAQHALQQPSAQHGTQHQQQFTAHAESQQHQQSRPASLLHQQLTRNSSHDVDMATDDQGSNAPYRLCTNPVEPEHTRSEVAKFLRSHSAFELMPESSKVVVIDVDLPVRQAFHALHEQGLASAPLWDSITADIIGVISASDFIHILNRLRNKISHTGNPMSESEMDQHTIRGLREEVLSEGRELKSLVYVRPEDSLLTVVEVMCSHKCSMAPMLSCDPGGEEIPKVLHSVGLSGVLCCLVRHFRSSFCGLPLLSQPIGSLPLGTWSPDASVSHTLLPDGKDGRQWRKVQQLHTITPSTPLTTALSMLLDARVSALAVVDDKRMLLDMYARSDITNLCKGNAYNRLQWEDVTVGQALSLVQSQPTAWSQQSLPSLHTTSQGHILNTLPSQLQPSITSSSLSQCDINPLGSHFSHSPHSRIHACTKDDSLHSVLDRLSIPGVRRVFVVQPETKRVEGIVSLSDVVTYLFL